MRRWWIAVALVVTTVVALDAQTPRPSFEVASVKPNKSGSCSPVSNSCQSFIRLQPGGNFLVGNMALRDLIQYAYRLQRFQLVGAPDWIANERFDIVAKAAGDPPPVMPGSGPDQLMLMLRALLAERFKLVTHRETREIPIYALVMARSNGQLGPQLRRSQTDCEAFAKAALAPNVSPPPNEQNGRPLCGTRGGGGTLIVGGLPMSWFPEFLAGHVQRVVVDRTSLTGAWDFDLTFAQEVFPQSPAGAPPTPDPTRPSLFTALQEQLGLRLEAMRGPVEVLVIDSVEQLTEN